MIQIELIRQLHNQLKLQDAKRRAYQEMYQETYQETSDAGKRLMHLKAESLKAQGKWDYYNNCPLVPDKLLIEMLKEDQMKYTLQDLMDMKGTSEPVRHALQAMSDEMEALRQDAERYRWLRENKFIWSDFGDAVIDAAIAKANGNDT